MLVRRLYSILLALAACNPADEAIGAGVPAPSTSTGLATGTSTTTRTATGSASASSSEEDSDGPSSFIARTDAHNPAIECDLFTQDCPRGEKCTIWANDGGPAWNATRCVDVVADPAQLDEPCTAVGSATSGADDCDVGLICFDVDEDLHGTCAAFCGGSGDAPTCPEGLYCAIGGSGFLVLCRPKCSPIEQDCPRGQACDPTNDGFNCAPDASGELGVHGDPCRYINSCDPGLICIGADLHTECPNDIGCCSTICDLSNPDADLECAALDPGQGCEAWFVEGMAPPEYENVGVCALPL